MLGVHSDISEDKGPLVLGLGDVGGAVLVIHPGELKGLGGLHVEPCIADAVLGEAIQAGEHVVTDIPAVAALVAELHKVGHGDQLIGVLAVDGTEQEDSALVAERGVDAQAATDSLIDDRTGNDVLILKNITFSF